jgi:hypothetical protein
MRLISAKNVMIVATAVAVVSTVCIAEDADASYRRLPGMKCRPYAASESSSSCVYAFEGTMTSTCNRAIHVDCAFAEDSALDKSSVGTTGGVWTDLYFPATTTVPATINACVYDCCSQSVVCGSGHTSGLSAGWQNPSADMTQWKNSTYAGWYPHVEILNLPAYASVNGVFFRN